MQNRKIALVGVLMAAVLAGCGGGGDGGDEAAPSPSPAPTPTPAPTPAPQAGSGRDCVNPDLHKVGTTYRIEQRASGAESGDVLREYAVKREAAFNGHAGLVEVELKTTTKMAGQPTRNGIQYLYERLEDATMFRYGMVIPTVLGQGLPDMVITTAYDPPVGFRSLALGAGESYVLELQGTVSATGGPTGSAPPTRISERWKETYLGQETVTVPAGTFTTCKLSTQVIGTNSDVTSWVAKGSGLPVRSVQRADGKEWVTELLPGGTINGQPIRIE